MSLTTKQLIILATRLSPHSPLKEMAEEALEEIIKKDFPKISNKNL